MKILKADRTEKEATVERFIQEAQVCSQLQHPNIMPFYDLGTLDTGHLFITMAELQGSSLDVFIDVYTEQARVKVRAERSAAGIFIDSFEHFKMFAMVSHAHDKNVLHRDLKPQNIMVHESGETLVVDWGLAKVLGSPENLGDVDTHRSDENAHATMAGGIFGTPIFLAPSAYERRGCEYKIRHLFTRRHIVWILRGVAPYKGKTALEVLLKVAKSPLSPSNIQRFHRAIRVEMSRILNGCI